MIVNTEINCSYGIAARGRHLYKGVAEEVARGRPRPNHYRAIIYDIYNRRTVR